MPRMALRQSLEDAKCQAKMIGSNRGRMTVSYEKRTTGTMRRSVSSVFEQFQVFCGTVDSNVGGSMRSQWLAIFAKKPFGKHWIL